MNCTCIFDPKTCVFKPLVTNSNIFSHKCICATHSPKLCKRTYDHKCSCYSTKSAMVDCKANTENHECACIEKSPSNCRLIQKKNIKIHKCTCEKWGPFTCKMIGAWHECICKVVLQKKSKTYIKYNRSKDKHVLSFFDNKRIGF